MQGREDGGPGFGTYDLNDLSDKLKTKLFWLCFMYTTDSSSFNRAIDLCSLSTDYVSLGWVFRKMLSFPGLLVLVNSYILVGLQL